MLSSRPASFVPSFELAHKVVDAVYEGNRSGTIVCRSELNTLFKAGTDTARISVLTEVIRNLLEHGYLEKRLDRERGRVFFWVGPKIDPEMRFILTEAPDPIVGQASDYENLYESQSAGKLLEARARQEEQTGQNAIERFLAKPKNRRSSYSRDRQSAILEFIENHTNRRIGLIKLELKQYFKPYLIDRDIDALIAQRRLGAVVDDPPYYEVIGKIQEPLTADEKADAVPGIPKVLEMTEHRAVEKSGIGAEVIPAAEPSVVYGVVDPDYARVFSKSRCIAWQYGYACTMHGSFTRDLDLLFVPWTDAAIHPDLLVTRLLDACQLRLLGKEGTPKSHGRTAYTAVFAEPEDPRFIDISVMPRLSQSIQ